MESPGRDVAFSLLSLYERQGEKSWREKLGGGGSHFVFLLLSAFLFSVAKDAILWEIKFASLHNSR